MLPAAFRLRSASDFATVTRGGHRVRSGDVVVYLMPAEQGLEPYRDVSDRTPSGMVGVAGAEPRAGLIVSRKVGGSVVRHQVSRRLRAQLATRLPALPVGTRVVVRALPSASSASSADLGAQLDAAFGRLTRRVVGR